MKGRGPCQVPAVDRCEELRAIERAGVPWRRGTSPLVGLPNAEAKGRPQVDRKGVHYIYIYIYRYKYLHTYIYINMYMYIYVIEQLYLYIYIYIMYLCVCVQLYSGVCLAERGRVDRVVNDRRKKHNKKWLSLARSAALFIWDCAASGT